MVTLRQLQETDRHDLAALANNRKIWLNLRDMMPHPYTLESADFFINMVKSNEQNRIRAIEFEGTFCGMIGLHRQADIYKLSAEIGYWIGEPFWGKGIASEAIQIIVNEGFTEMNLERIYAGVFVHNTTSMRVLEKNGFEKEGISKRAIIKDGVILDEYRYSLLVTR